MTGFDAHHLCKVSGGTWLLPPCDQIIIDGLGIDTRDDLAGKAFVAIKGANHDGHAFLDEAVSAGASLLIVEIDIEVKRLPEHVPVLKVTSTRKALGSIASDYRRSLVNTRVVAITGSSGKTTTKGLIDAVLRSKLRGASAKQSFNNDIGVPLTLLSANRDDDYLIVEVGTNARGEIDQLAQLIEPDIAVITSIGRAHLQGLGTIQDVAHEKLSLLNHLRPGSVAILNADSLSQFEINVPDIRSVTFGESAGADIHLIHRGRDNDSWWFEISNGRRFRLPIPGKHNAINALATVAVASEFGLDDDSIRTGLMNARTAHGRMTVERVRDIMIWNDSYNANPDSTIAALETFGEEAADADRRIVILGDMLELGDQAEALHREIGLHVLRIHARAPIHRGIFVGQFAMLAGEECSAVGGAIEITSSPELNDRVCREIVSMFQRGDEVLIKGSRGMRLERIVNMFKQSDSDHKPVPEVVHAL